MYKKLKLKYRAPAEDSIEGWEHYSLPLGNGYMGANVFGIVEKLSAIPEISCWKRREGLQ